MEIQLIQQPSPDDHIWIRQIFSALPRNGAQLVLHDHSRGLYLPVTGARSLNVAAVPFDDVVINVQPDNLASPARIVAHIGGTRDEVAGQLFTVPKAPEMRIARQTIILEVSGQGAVPSDSISSPNIVWLSMKSREAYKKTAEWLPQFLDLSFEDAVKIAKAKDRGELPPTIQDAYAKLLDITHPGDAAAPLAFRLLCEAWKIKNVDKKDACEGIPITAPSNLTDWLAPFSPDGNDDLLKIASVVSKMGNDDTKTKVKNVLDAVHKKENPLDHVSSFLGIKNNASNPSEGGEQ